jgi:hypothetical protein
MAFVTKYSGAAVLFAMAVTGPLTAAQQELIVTKGYDRPILSVRSAGAEGNKYGFEGGRVVKLNGTYHMFTSEMVADPHWVKMKLAHWTSQDRIHWQRIGTVRESSGDFTGRDPRAALWSPMPVFDEKNNRWNLFYVAYQAAPDTPREWLTNHEGRIWRAESTIAGADGIAGPYRDVGVVLERGPDSDPWEGLQGTDSFFPFQVGDRWYAFYGSARTEKLPIALWQVGLAEAFALAGPWKRCTKLNPLGIESRFIENPIVTKLRDGSYIAVYDSHQPDAIGYSFSADGTRWSAGQKLEVQTGKGIWASEVRTPLGLIDEGNDTFTLFYSGNEKIPGEHADANGIVLTPGALGIVDVRLERDRAGRSNSEAIGSGNSKASGGRSVPALNRNP